MQLKFEKCSLKDLDLIYKLFSNLEIDEAKQQSPIISKKKMLDGLKKMRSFTKKRLSRELKNKDHYWYFIKYRGSLAGFINIKTNNIKTLKVGVLEKIYVLPEFRRKGIAKNAIKFILKKFKSQGIKTVTARVYAKNIPSIKLNESLGFVQTSIDLRKNL